MRFVKGITLTPEERRMAGYDGGSTIALLKDHSGEVTLPDGRSCGVTYRRQGPTAHEFAFGPPLSRRSLSNARLQGSPESIMAAAVELAAAAFRTAQRDEQQGMRRKSRPKGWTDGLPDDALRLKPQSAADLAGLYAVCVRTASGSLAPCGPAYPDAETAVQERACGTHDRLRLSDGQRLAIGICCRFARRWYEAQFVPLPSTTHDEDTVEADPDAEQALAS